MAGFGLPDSTISSSRELGTIDNLALSPLGLLGVICAQYAPAFASTLVQSLVSVVLVGFIVDLPISWSLGPLLIYSFVAGLGMLGLGFIFGALTLQFRRLGTLKNLFFVLLFTLGIMPIGEGTTGLSVLAHYFPYTQGLLLTRYALLPSLANESGLTMMHLLLSSSVSLVLGIVAFKLSETKAKREGTLSNY